MTTFLFPAILASESVATDSVNPRLAHKNCNVARNRREHVFHRAPELTADGYPSRWHHIELHPDMWRDDFVAKARIVAKQREATRIEQERLQAEKRAQREAEIRSQLSRHCRRTRTHWSTRATRSARSNRSRWISWE